MVYGSNVRTLKQAFWEKLRASRGPSHCPWVVCGDFNAIFALEDKMFGVHNLMDIQKANDFMQGPGTIGTTRHW